MRYVAPQSHPTQTNRLQGNPPKNINPTPVPATPTATEARNAPNPANGKNPRISHQPVHNRILAILAHTSRYAFKGEKRLAQDCGASPSAISRVVTGQSSPSFSLVAAITKALEKCMGKRIDPREIVSPDGTYPTPSVCQLMECKGCLPAEAFDSEEMMTHRYQEIAPGTWSGSVEPKRKTKAAQ